MKLVIFKSFSCIVQAIPFVKDLHELIVSAQKHKKFKCVIGGLLLCIVLFGVIFCFSSQAGKEPETDKPGKNESTEETAPTQSPEKTETAEPVSEYQQIAGGENHTVFIYLDNSVGATGDVSKERCDVSEKIL